jgi:membrane-associated phospholipid phosphatase
MSLTNESPAALPRDMTSSPSSSARRARRIIIHFTLCLGALALAFSLDRPIAQALRDAAFPNRFKGSLLAELLKIPGDFWFTATLAAILWIFHPRGWRAAVLVCLAALVSGINSILKWTTGRVRPFKIPGRPDDLLPFHFDPFIGGIPGLWSAKNICFPSGHAALAFATAQMLAMLLPCRRWWFYAIACIVGLERILENAHYASDVVAAAILAIYGAKLVWHLCNLLLPDAPVGATPVSPSSPINTNTDDTSVAPTRTT